MKLAVISDIHSNLEALEAALKAIEPHGVDAVYCLGDIVGYGADPSACVELVRAHCDGVVHGNHETAVALDEDVKFLPRDGKEAVYHNRGQLTEEQLAYLGDLPLFLEASGFTFVHATPELPGQWQRLDSFVTAQRQFDHFTTDVCFVGHTHVPAVLANRLGVLRVRSGHRYLINVGSVGQPRDDNPQLSFAIFDGDAFSLEIVRVPYDVEQAASKIVAAGLPERLASRLKVGL